MGRSAAARDTRVAALGRAPTCFGSVAFGTHLEESAAAAGGAAGADLDEVAVAKRSLLRESVGAVSRNVGPVLPSSRAT